jgi:diguanylate cyclase
MKSSFYRNFDEAGTAVLKYLHKRLGFGLWMLTRTEGENWIVLQSVDNGYDVAPGKVFRWADSFCSQMVCGNGPNIAPDTNLVPAYASAPIGKAVPIGSYIGVPLLGLDGNLFGTLCAIDPLPKEKSIESELEQIKLLAALLSKILRDDLAADADKRRLEKLNQESRTDALTGLANRRAWDEFLKSEEDRCRRYGHPAVVFSIDLDGLKLINDSAGHAAGDEFIVRAANSFRDACWECDFVARLGGDEFGIIGIECDQDSAEDLFARIKSSLADFGVQASVGMGIRKHGAGFSAAWEKADEHMYGEKRSH